MTSSLTWPSRLSKLKMLTYCKFLLYVTAAIYLYHYHFGDQSIISLSVKFQSRLPLIRFLLCSILVKPRHPRIDATNEPPTNESSSLHKFISDRTAENISHYIICGQCNQSTCLRTGNKPRGSPIKLRHVLLRVPGLICFEYSGRI